MTKRQQCEEQFSSLCMGCMEEKSGKSICEKCKYKEEEATHHPSYLKPRTCLNSRYLVGRVLEQGGFGISYVGFDTKLCRKVAIKEYFPSMLASRDGDQHHILPSLGENRKHFFKQGLLFFIEEAQKLAKFERVPSIVNVYDVFEEHGTGYMVMEFLEGGNLSTLLKTHGGKISIKKAKKILHAILTALKALHTADLYHRDISPQNIMFNSYNEPILIDFGAARYIVGEQSQTLDIVQKPGYSPLEQLSSKGNIGPWTDIYSCGATFYSMITGETPPPANERVYEDDLIQPSDFKHLRKQHLSPQLNDTILRTLAVREQDRFQNIEAFERKLYEEGTSFQTSPKSKMPLFIVLSSIFSLLSIGIYYNFSLIQEMISHQFEQFSTPTSIPAPTQAPTRLPTSTPVPTPTPIPTPTLPKVFKDPPAIFSVEIDIIPSPKQNIIDLEEETDTFALNPRSSTQNIRYEWQLNGPGELIAYQGDSEGIFYVPPKQLEGKSSQQVIITLHADGDGGNRVTESITFTLRDVEKTPQLPKMESIILQELGGQNVRQDEQGRYLLEPGSRMQIVSRSDTREPHSQWIFHYYSIRGVIDEYGVYTAPNKRGIRDLITVRASKNGKEYALPSPVLKVRTSFSND